MHTFDFPAALQQRTSSLHTARAYYRWLDQYLVDLASMKPSRGETRLKRMSALSPNTLYKILTAHRFSEWLHDLADEGHGRQGLDQARAAIVTLAELMAESDCLPQDTAISIQKISVPPIEKPQHTPVLLNQKQLKQLMNAARDMATSQNQMIRNQVVSTMLCTLALRREELSATRWGDVHLDKGRVHLHVRAQGSRAGQVKISPALVTMLDRWRGTIGEPGVETPLVRRIWRGGRIARNGLSPDGIWLIIRDASQTAGLGHVTPDDLRRSVAAGLRDAGASLEDISKLLRHRSIIVTERYLKRLPRRG